MLVPWSSMSRGVQDRISGATKCAGTRSSNGHATFSNSVTGGPYASSNHRIWLLHIFFLNKSRFKHFVTVFGELFPVIQMFRSSSGLSYSKSRPTLPLPIKAIPSAASLHCLDRPKMHPEAADTYARRVSVVSRGKSEARHICCRRGRNIRQWPL